MKEGLKRWLTSGLLASTAISGSAIAGPYGYDLHNVLAPRSGGMAGTSIAQPQDVVSAVFGNAATLTQWTGTTFDFGATYYKPEVRLDSYGAVGTPTFFNVDNGNEGYIVPQIAVAQDLRPLGLPAVLGAGLTAVSGIGVQFQHDPATLGLGAEFIVLGANFALGWELSENLSVGGAATVTYAYLDLGLASTSEVTHDIGVRGTLGLTYDNILPDTTVGLNYWTELKHNFDDIIAVPAAGGGARFQSIEIEEPRNVALGIANTSLLGGDLLLAADAMWKNWDDAEFWEDVFDDQYVFTVGAQLSRGKWRYRGGYGYSTDPTDRDARRVAGGDITTVCSGLACGVALPIGDGTQVGQNVLDYLRMGETEVIYQHRLSAGLGYEGFLAPFLDLDGHFGWQFKERNHYGVVGNAEVWSWHTGFGLTWNFQ